MLCLYVQAPFAAFRTFTAGSFRQTAPFMTFTAAYGLLLNLAGIEMRLDADDSPMTLTNPDLPSVELALGAIEWPEEHCLLQQLHNYPVGSSGQQYEAQAWGSKYNIAPVKRGLLSNLRALICLRGNDEFLEAVLRGLRGLGPERYGLPFLGENNYLPDRIEPRTSIPAALWVVTANTDSASGSRAMRLTVEIDRRDMSRTRSALFRLTDAPNTKIPEDAWVTLGRT